MSQDFVGRPHDFAFLVGVWNVVNRRLHQRHVGSNDWDEFPSVLTNWGLLDGIVSVEEIRYPTKDFSGCTVRTLDRAARRWSIYWINSTTGVVDPPVQGGFHDGRGEFYGDDTDAGRPVRVRFVWTRNSADAARWEQAFSTDGGATWEINWIMALTRAAG